MTAKVSGGKLNPAVSLGLLVSGSISAYPPWLGVASATAVLTAACSAVPLPA